jgi:hypothetical protein
MGVAGLSRSISIMHCIEVDPQQGGTFAIEPVGETMETVPIDVDIHVLSKGKRGDQEQD